MYFFFLGNILLVFFVFLLETWNRVLNFFINKNLDLKFTGLVCRCIYVCYCVIIIFNYADNMRKCTFFWVLYITYLFKYLFLQVMIFKHANLLLNNLLRGTHAGGLNLTRNDWKLYSSIGRHFMIFLK